VRAAGRAAGPLGTAGIMAPRTLANSHPTLLPLLAPGVSVLDVGSGPGALTAEIARRVAPGRVVGLDVNREMARLAAEQHASPLIPNLVFAVGDIRAAEWHGEFDVVNAARTLQWIPDCPTALSRMVRATAPGGRVVAMDADLARVEWSGPPRPWSRFVSAFLEWRAAQGLENTLASRLPELLRKSGLAEVESVPRVTRVRATDADFFRLAGAWRMLAESRGRQMVAAGLLGERERSLALASFTRWMQRPGAAQTTWEACAVGRRQ